MEGQSRTSKLTRTEWSYNNLINISKIKKIKGRNKNVKKIKHKGWSTTVFTANVYGLNSDIKYVLKCKGWVDKGMTGISK